MRPIERIVLRMAVLEAKCAPGRGEAAISAILATFAAFSLFPRKRLPTEAGFVFANFGIGTYQDKYHHAAGPAKQRPLRFVAAAILYRYVLH
jgi:hypothetical protein